MACNLNTDRHTQQAVRNLSEVDGRFMAGLKYHSLSYGKETETGGSSGQGQGKWHAAFMAFITTSSYDKPFVIRHSSNEVSTIHTAKDTVYTAVRSSACFNSKID